MMQSAYLCVILFTDKNGDFGAIFVTERNCATPISKVFIYLFIYYFPTIKITQALHYTKMWRGDLRKPQGLYEEAPSLQ